jgi:ABC-type nitrate/sulfonate/bicarbonate transport system permease component
MVISEMQASSNGLGYRVLEAQRGFDAAGMFAGIVVIGFVGVVLNAVFVVGERRIMHWYYGAQGL